MKLRLPPRGRAPPSRAGGLQHAGESPATDWVYFCLVLAARIVAWRDEHGPFAELGQLRDVPGIGERIFQNLADLLSV